MVNSKPTDTTETPASPTAPTGRKWWQWIIPKNWRKALFRVAVIAVLLIIFRYEAITWVIAGHNVLWKSLHPNLGNHTGDMATLARLRKPGARMLIRLNEEIWLSDVNDPAMIPTLLDLARTHPNPSVRACALDGLANFWDEAILPTCMSALSHPDPYVRLAAARTIAMLGDAKSGDDLRGALNSETDSRVASQIRRTIAALPPSGQINTTSVANTVRVAAIQFMSEFGKPEENRERLEPLIREAAANGAEIVVLPETSITGYMNYDLDITWQVDRFPLSEGLRGVSPAQSAEPVPGPSTDYFAHLADELDIYLTIPFLEIDPHANKFYNTLVLTGPEGGILLHYRKLNPWPFAEQAWASPGDHGLQYIDTPYGRLALLICYDINFEPPRLKNAKVDTLLYSIAWVDKARSPWFYASLPRIARENEINIIGANWTVPREPSWHGYGQSLIIEKNGRVLVRATRNIGEEILYADLPLPPTENPAEVAPSFGAQQETSPQ